MTATQGTERDWSQYPENNPFYSSETSDAEDFARSLLDSQDDADESN